jgi:hypothetical protein
MQRFHEAAHGAHDLRARDRDASPVPAGGARVPGRWLVRCLLLVTS